MAFEIGIQHWHSTFNIDIQHQYVNTTRTPNRTEQQDRTRTRTQQHPNAEHEQEPNKMPNMFRIEHRTEHRTDQPFSEHRTVFFANPAVKVALLRPCRVPIEVLSNPVPSHLGVPSFPYWWIVHIVDEEGLWVPRSHLIQPGFDLQQPTSTNRNTRGL